ncbi:tryptophan-rich sensory protein [Rossellomorea aquimaris]|uniref:TspO/MBR family protein n=1 Tax=Rossellomorea aquimaris TaxID=189382 RepID=UPI001CD1DF59|nr:TspO/MBR family protein [Rossellomorea aquimaris]MCA1056013.1 tryptophan-rich sensory protein [Rossellomorea aquimaris]
MKKLILNILAYLLVIVMNTLAVTLPLNNQSTSEISDRLDILLTPAGYVFSIWSLIYLLLGIWIIRQFPKRRRDLPLYQHTSGLFILSCLLNSGWILVWHYNYFLISVFVMIGLFLTLAALYRAVKETDPSLLDRAPFSVYLGWISIAMLVNILYYFTDIGLIGEGSAGLYWSLAGLLIATILAIWVRVTQRDWLYPLVFVWAFIGIGVKNAGEHAGYAYTAYALALLILLVTLFYRKR